MIKKLLFLGLLSCGIANLNAVVAVGDTVGSSTTFSFSVGSAIYNMKNQQLWTLSGQDTSSFSPGIQSYGIAYTPFIPVDASLGMTLRAYPYLTSQAFITTTDGSGNLLVPTNAVVNPLLGQAFGSVTYLNTFLTVFNSLSPQYIYLIQSVFFSDGASLGTTSPEGISIINLLDLGAPNQAVALGGSVSGVIFIANAQGTFGINDSQISFASATTMLAPINGQDTTCTIMIKQADEPVTTSTPVLTAGGAHLASIGSSVAMYPSQNVGLQMYIGLDVTAGAGSQAVGLFTALANQKTDTTPASITFSSVLPNGIGQDVIQTPVSTTAGDRVAVSNITTTMTSTGLS
ncbi:MAG: hypothetical protein JO129_01610, partial [Candidatus Dependentiae bacterium]|nr:hypothetical protein [Candidatus Dependentiae bacterium]